jgi:hypothetical protein
MLQLIVLYPQPANVQQFEADYANHLALLHEKTGIPTTVKTLYGHKIFTHSRRSATILSNVYNAI